MSSSSIIYLFIVILILTCSYYVNNAIKAKEENRFINSFNVVSTMSISISIVSLYSLIIEYIKTDNLNFYLMGLFIIFLILLIYALYEFISSKKHNIPTKTMIYTILEKIALALLSSTLVISIKDVMQFIDDKAFWANVFILITASISFILLGILRKYKDT